MPGLGRLVVSHRGHMRMGCRMNAHVGGGVVRGVRIAHRGSARKARRGRRGGGYAAAKQHGRDGHC